MLLLCLPRSAPFSSGHRYPEIRNSTAVFLRFGFVSSGSFGPAPPAPPLMVGRCAFSCFCLAVIVRAVSLPFPSFRFPLRSCKITDGALEALSVRCPSLEWLDLSWCGGVTDRGFCRLAEGCSGLEEVGRLPLRRWLAPTCVYHATKVARTRWNH